MKKCVFGVWCALSFLFFSAFSSPQDSLILRLATTTNDSVKVSILSKLATSYAKDDMTVSLKYAKEMVDLINKLPEDRVKGSYYADAAIIYLNCNIYDKTLELLFEALKIFERLGDKRSITMIKNNMGGVYLRLGKHGMALKYFTEGLEEAKKQIEAGDSTFVTRLHAYYNNIGLIYNTDKNKRVLAGTYLEKALETVPPSDYLNLGQYYNNMAQYYYETGKKEKAFQCAEKSMEYRKLDNSEYGIARTNYTLANFYYQEKDFKKAKNYLKEAEATGERLNSSLILSGVYELFVKIYEMEEDYKTANAYLKKNWNAQNQLVNDTILTHTATLKLEYDFAQQTALHQAEVAQAKVKLRLTLYIAGLLLVVFALLFFLIRFRNRQIRLEKTNLELDLETKNKELTTNVMYLMRNTDMIRRVIEQLVKLKPKLKAENSDVIKDIILDLESLLKDDLWNEFETHFNRVHVDFYRKLKVVCPDLTPTELKMCAFLRLNMSSKEISSISGITVKSVEVMRGRIRKKLSISNTDTNLINFLSDF